MRWQRTARRAAMKMCAAAAVLTAGAWALSAWCTFGYSHSTPKGTTFADIGAGRASLGRINIAIQSNDGPRTRWTGWRGWNWTFGSTRTGTRGVSMSVIRIPLWSAGIGAGAPAFALWRLDRRIARAGIGRCPACGYDRAGIGAGAPCPECGSEAHRG